MREKSWSLASRLTWTFLISTTGLVVAISLVSAWFLHESVDRELDALLVEELDEMNALFRHSERDEAAFAEIAGQLLANHPSNPLAWRVWDTATGELWGDFGSTYLLAEDVPARDVEARSVRSRAGLRWRTERLDSGHTVGLVLDGSAQITLLRRYQAFAGLLVLASGIVALFVGRVLIRRSCRVLRDVAERTRGAGRSLPGAAIERGDLPEEMRAIVDALEALLAQTRGEMEQAQLFMAALAHEMRSPIQNLVGETEVALLSERDPETYRSVLRSHLEEIRDLGTAVDNLLSICSPRSDEAGPGDEDFDLGDEARLRLERAGASAGQVGVDVELDVVGSTRVRGDREAILRALRNLTENAIKWSAAGDKVFVRIRGEDGSVHVTVDDAGPGVPEELCERIFEAFFRGPSVAGARIGYGLGLAIVRMAAEAQGGDVRVERSPAGGARFRLTLPREPLRGARAAELERASA